MPRECRYTQQLYAIFIEIVLFVVFVIFVGVFEPSYALCHCTQQFVFFFFFRFLSKLLSSFSLEPLDPLILHDIELNSFSFVILLVLLTTFDYL